MIGPAFPQVLEAARTGAPWALEALYRELAGPVTGYLRLHGAAEPDDLASEVFVGVLTGVGGFVGDEAGFRAWVFTIAHRRLADSWRRASRRPALADVDVHDHAATAALTGGDAEEEALASLGTSRVHDLCARLPREQRAVVLLRVLGDLSVAEVARVLGKTPASVKALQHRGLLTLSAQCGDDRATPRASAAMTETR
ncbi:RNA polymerase sigma factor [Quadrisphaera oryzae]|uniref:RNA polymerase sigma factor n=1 Tax=Quadrisphaera TaxID=317661 RepID=UPI001647C3AC|nr:sigma-70 family RNA polymerase sigma factor [Quadrisphaera sp. RL12-1S]